MMKIAIAILTVFLMVTGCSKQLDTSEFQLSPTDVTDATMTAANADTYTVNITLSEAASQRLAQCTKENIGKKLPLVIDGKVVSEPVVREVIAGPKLTIAGQKKEDAERILQSLKSPIKGTDH